MYCLAQTLFKPCSFTLRKLVSEQRKSIIARQIASSNGPSPLTMLTEDELSMKETAARFAKEKVFPYVREMEETGKIKDEIVQQLFANGFMGIEIPAKYGGAESTFMMTIQAIEELSKIDPVVGLCVELQNALINSIIIKLGTEEQKAKYLPKLATEITGAFAFTEATSGSDAFALKMTAKKDGPEHYVINGSKMWTSFAYRAGVFIVMANAKPEAGYKGITSFLIDRDAEGVIVAQPENKLGLRASGSGTVHFDNVKVHQEQILGEFGKGYKYAVGFLNEGRIGISAQMVGLAQGAMDATVPYLMQRHQFGSPIFDFQSMQHQIADMTTQLEAGRLLTYNAARLVERGEDFVQAASMAKYFMAKMAQQVAVKCIDWMGGVGFTKDFPHEKFYRDVKAGSIYEGTANMQLSTIAKLVRKQYSN